MGFNSAFKGLK